MIPYEEVVDIAKVNNFFIKYSMIMKNLLLQAKQSVAELKEQHRSITANLPLYPSTPAVDMAMLTPNDAASIQTLESVAVSHITQVTTYVKN